MIINTMFLIGQVVSITVNSSYTIKVTGLFDIFDGRNETLGLGL